MDGEIEIFDGECCEVGDRNHIDVEVQMEEEKHQRKKNQIYEPTKQMQNYGIDVACNNFMCLLINTRRLVLNICNDSNNHNSDGLSQNKYSLNCCLTPLSIN